MMTHLSRRYSGSLDFVDFVYLQLSDLRKITRSLENNLAKFDRYRTCILFTKVYLARQMLSNYNKIWKADNFCILTSV